MYSALLKTTIVELTESTIIPAGTGRTIYIANTLYAALWVYSPIPGSGQEILIVNGRGTHPVLVTGWSVRYPFTLATINGVSGFINLVGIGEALRLTQYAGQIVCQNFNLVVA